jgi:hypothetical protein
MFIIMTGNPSRGFIFIGPFVNHEDAADYILRHPLEVKEEFFILPLHRPII